MTVVTTGPRSPETLLEILDATGHHVDPAELTFASRVLLPSELTAIANLARSAGLVLERDGLAIFGLGVAARFLAPSGFGAKGSTTALADHLSAIAALDTSEVAIPIVMGSLPFDSSAAAELVIPTVVARVEDGQPVLICVAGAGEINALVSNPTAAIAEPGAPTAPPDHFELISVQSHERFKDLVSDAVAAIASGEFQKVVVAREVEVRANRPFAPSDLLGRLRALYPSCATFSMGNFVGASPELLCRKKGSLASAHPLAGTVARSGDPEEDQRLARSLFASPKERSEHGIVVAAIADALRTLAPDVTASPEPHLLELRNVVHLATTIEAHLSEPMPKALELALALHPTPAVGGFPRAAALAWLSAHEALDRDRYAGPLGYMDAAGDGEWWLGIRSALLSGSSARLLAGVGIVADSEPAAELSETQLKLQALLAAAVRP